jgi:CheY-like chemotaxis protein
MAKPTLLIVDDDESVLDYLRIKLGARYDVVATNSSNAALGLARERRPDLILCDLDMPGMNGGQVSAALFADEELRHTPLVFLSGTVAPHELKRLQGTVGRPALTKSTPLPELVARIEALLRPSAA